LGECIGFAARQGRDELVKVGCIRFAQIVVRQGLRETGALVGVALLVAVVGLIRWMLAAAASLRR
jgi:hypothetical protein